MSFLIKRYILINSHAKKRMHILEFNIKIDTLCKLFCTNFLHKLNYLSQDEKAKKVIEVRSCGLSEQSLDWESGLHKPLDLLNERTDRVLRIPQNTNRLIPNGSNEEGWWFSLDWICPSLVAQMVKRLLTMMWETRVQSLGREDPLEKEMATHSSILAWKIPWTEELGWLLSMGSQRVGHNWATSLHFTSVCMCVRVCACVCACVCVCV